MTVVFQFQSWWRSLCLSNSGQNIQTIYLKMLEDNLNQAELEEIQPLEYGGKIYAHMTFSLRALPSLQNAGWVTIKQRTTNLLAWGVRRWNLGLPEHLKAGGLKSKIAWVESPQICIYFPKSLLTPELHMNKDTPKIGRKKQLEAWKSWAKISGAGHIRGDSVEFESCQIIGSW